MEQLNNSTLRLSKHHLAVFALIIANTIWGAGSPIFKWSLQDIQPFTLAFLRFFIGALILLPFIIHKLHIDRKDWLRIVLLSLAGITINISFYFLGLQKTASVNAPIIASSAPIFIIFASVLFLKEHPKRITLIGTLLSLLGVLVIIIEPLIEHGLDASLLGNLFLILSTFGGVIHTILLRGISKKYPVLAITFWSFFIGSISFLPFFGDEVRKYGFLTNLSGQGLFGILFGAILSSALAYYLYTLALKYMIASESSVFTYIDPVIAIIIAIPLLGEKITPVFILGSILVFGGIFIAENRLPWHPIHKLRLKPLAREGVDAV